MFEVDTKEPTYVLKHDVFNNLTS